MKAAFKYFFNDIKRGENIDLYISLLLSVVLAILGIIGTIQISILSAGILAALSVFAYNTLATRRTISDISHIITALQPTENSSLKDRSKFTSLKDRLEGVDIVWLLGPSLVNLLPPNVDLFFEKVKKGTEIRILVFNPESSYISLIADQISVRTTRLKIDINKTLDECADFIQDGLGNGKLEVRLTEVIPGYSMVVLDPFKPSGHLAVEYLGYRSSLNGRPHVDLEASKNRHWFDYYRNQYEELWSAATPFNSTDHLA